MIINNNNPLSVHILDKIRHVNEQKQGLEKGLKSLKKQHGMFLFYAWYVFSLRTTYGKLIFYDNICKHCNVMYTLFNKQNV